MGLILGLFLEARWVEIRRYIKYYYYYYYYDLQESNVLPRKKVVVVGWWHDLSQDVQQETTIYGDSELWWDKTKIP